MSSACCLTMRPLTGSISFKIMPVKLCITETEYTQSSRNHCFHSYLFINVLISNIIMYDMKSFLWIRNVEQNIIVVFGCVQKSENKKYSLKTFLWYNPFS